MIGTGDSIATDNQHVTWDQAVKLGLVKDVWWSTKFTPAPQTEAQRQELNKLFRDFDTKKGKTLDEVIDEYSKLFVVVESDWHRLGRYVCVYLATFGAMLVFHGSRRRLV